MRHEMLFPVGPDCFASIRNPLHFPPTWEIQQFFTPHQNSFVPPGPDRIATTVFHSKFLHELVYPPGKECEGLIKMHWWIPFNQRPMEETKKTRFGWEDRSVLARRRPSLPPQQFLCSRFFSAQPTLSPASSCSAGMLGKAYFANLIKTSAQY